jgi:hypothetical protein
MAVDGPEWPPPAPEGLTQAGTTLWGDICALRELDALQLVVLTEICRLKGRLDQYDAILRGDADTWMWLVTTGPAGIENQLDLKIDNVALRADAAANLIKQLFASLRLPDEVTGKRPQQRNTGSGVNKPSGKKGLAGVSSLERARQAKNA